MTRFLSFRIIEQENHSRVQTIPSRDFQIRTMNSDLQFSDRIVQKIDCRITQMKRVQDVVGLSHSCQSCSQPKVPSLAWLRALYVWAASTGCHPKGVYWRCSDWLVRSCTLMEATKPTSALKPKNLGSNIMASRSFPKPWSWTSAWFIAFILNRRSSVVAKWGND